MSVNHVTETLPPYPMEELAKIKQRLTGAGRTVYDFGTGDPTIPTWQPIKDSIKGAIPDVSQYPSIKGTPALTQAIWGYLGRRFDLKPSAELGILPTNGSKESVFHIALCLIGRAGGRKHLLYPNPGYPVYRSSALFAGGIAYPVDLKEDNGYLLEPWTLPEAVQKDTAALWINYPHNPTGATAPKEYLEKVIAWAHERDVVLLSDDCYVDIYDTKIDRQPTANGLDQRPLNPITLATKNIISFMSLSKRSGLTGYRSGFMVGDSVLIEKIGRARANFGVSAPSIIQAGAITAWNDDEHVEKRRAIFTDRIRVAAPVLQELGMLDSAPEATFYLWCRLPKSWGDDDTGFCLELAERGVIASPSQWLSEGIRGYIRLALVPDVPDIEKALAILKEFVKESRRP